LLSLRGSLSRVTGSLSRAPACEGSRSSLALAVIAWEVKKDEDASTVDKDLALLSLQTRAISRCSVC
jgi:hypothetical protein